MQEQLNQSSQQTLLVHSSNTAVITIIMDVTQKRTSGQSNLT